MDIIIKNAKINQKLVQSLEEKVKYVENELLTHKNMKTKLEEKLSVLEGYVANQDYINKLKLRERTLLLKEMTVQIHELRSQISKDKKLLLKIEQQSESISKGPQFPVMKSSSSSHLPKTAKGVLFLKSSFLCNTLCNCRTHIYSS